MKFIKQLYFLFRAYNLSICIFVVFLAIGLFLHNSFGLIWEHRLLATEKIQKGIGYPGTHAYSIPLGTTWMGQDKRGTSAPAQVLEDGGPLAFSDSLHAEIAEKGAGRYSLWGGNLYFSSSDNSDPRTNLRRYQLYWPTPVNPVLVWMVYSLAIVGSAFQFYRLVGNLGGSVIVVLSKDLIRIVGGIGFVFLVLWAVVFGVAASNKYHIMDMNINSVEMLIINAQMERLAAFPEQDIVMLGDSSCLMGILPTHLERILGKSIQSYCTIGYVGPEGYSYMLDMLAEKKESIDTVILALHPIQFHRDKLWEQWVPLVKDRNKRKKDIAYLLQVPFSFIRAFTNQYLIYSPLPGAYSLYYGSPTALVNMINNTHGSAIDPGGGLMINNYSSMKTLPDAGPGNYSFDFSITPLYRNALTFLRKSIANFGPQKVVLLLTPIPSVADDQMKKDIVAAFYDIAMNIGIPENNIVIPEASFCTDGKYFSSITHLNRFGQILFTDAVGKELQFYYKENYPLK